MYNNNYPQRNYPQRGNSGYNNNGYNQQRQQRKRSGAKMTQGKNQAGESMRVISAWKVSKRFGMIKLVACQRKDGKTAETRGGHLREMWVCNIQKAMCKDETYTGFFDDSSKKLRIPDLNLVASCNAPNGGYFGKSVFKRK